MRFEVAKQIILSSELSMKIDKIIYQLRQKIYPDCIILTDISGQLLSSYARYREISVDNLAALFASNMGATGEIASELSEKESFECNLHEGKQRSIFVSKIGGSFLLAVIFPSSTAVGMIRLFTKRACKELLALTKDFEQQLGAKVKTSLRENFSDELSNKFMELLETKKG